eukprot:1138055-Pelagomonas_calceolata.AAC.5
MELPRGPCTEPSMPLLALALFLSLLLSLMLSLLLWSREVRSWTAPPTDRRSAKGPLMFNRTTRRAGGRERAMQAMVCCARDAQGAECLVCANRSSGLVEDRVTI